MKPTVLQGDRPGYYGSTVETPELCLGAVRRAVPKSNTAIYGMDVTLMS